MKDVSFLDAVLEDAFRADERLVLLSTAPPAELAGRFGAGRVRTMPISESAIGVAAGGAR